MSTAREYHTQQLHYLRKSIAYTDDGTELDVGVIPSGSLIMKALSGVHVVTAFNASAGNVLQVGGSAGVDDPNAYGSSLALGTETFVPLDISDGTVYLVTVDVTISASVELTGTAATAGAGEVVICYVPDNDG